MLVLIVIALSAATFEFYTIYKQSKEFNIKIFHL